MQRVWARKQPDPLADHSELLDIVLLASVDGKFPCPQPHHGPYSLVHVVVLLLLEHGCFAAGPHETYIIEPQSGDIYVLVPPHSRSAPLQRFPFATADDHHVFVGRKATSEVVVELETGAGPIWRARYVPAQGRWWSAGPTIMSRSIHGRPTKHGLVPVQTLAFSTYGPSSRDNVLQSSYRSTEDRVYIQSLPNGEVISFKARGEGEDHSVLWGCKFKSPNVNCGDIRRTPEPYPAPHLRPPPAPSAALRYPPKLAQTTSTDQLPHLESAYVGLVEESGSLFAMSPDRFPLVAFTAGRKRREKRDGAAEPRLGGR
ncbi:hypothetical protein B0H14DRAFT_3543971 [Mycena olivaceomarginata]|nr:hypothetical protein B0H14DRAFT_3543971 [Mycena olivaceomarginata]